MWINELKLGISFKLIFCVNLLVYRLKHLVPLYAILFKVSQIALLTLTNLNNTQISI